MTVKEEKKRKKKRKAPLAGPRGTIGLGTHLDLIRAARPSLAPRRKTKLLVRIDETAKPRVLPAETRREFAESQKTRASGAGWETKKRGGRESSRRRAEAPLIEKRC